VFCSADPAIWNSSVSAGRTRFAVPLSQVPADVSFLRLRISEDRLVIIPMTKDLLAGSHGVPGSPTYGWNGTNYVGGKGVRHLGIYSKRWNTDNPSSIKVGEVRGKWFTGWGFGDLSGKATATQECCWNGKRIGGTVFEIAVKRGRLEKGEQRYLLP
jgi:hypothetical protein